MIFDRFGHAGRGFACTQHNRAAPWWRGQMFGHAKCGISRCNGSCKHIPQKGAAMIHSEGRQMMLVPMARNIKTRCAPSLAAKTLHIIHEARERSCATGTTHKSAMQTH
jgi:hypothetical protein